MPKWSTAPPGCTDMPLGCVRTVPQSTSWAGRRQGDGWLLDGTYEAYVRFPIKSLLASVALGIGQI